MRNKISLAIAIVMVSGLVFTGCSVMHFKNGQVESPGRLQNAWHHDGIFSLVEFSPVVDLKKNCPDKGWSMITTKRTAPTFLAGIVDNLALGLLLPIGIDIWDPQALEWYCR